MNPVVHFEMPYEDRDRMAAFYEKAFGWKLQKLGEEMGSYVVAHTTETDDQGMIKTPGHINGGFFKKNSENPGTNVVIAVADINAAVEKIKAEGCKTDEIMDIPGIGKYCTFFDTEGNRVSVMQPTRM